MTITELLTTHPGVIITLVYSETHKLFSLTANRGSVEFATTWTKSQDENTDILSVNLNRAMEAVK